MGIFDNLKNAFGSKKDDDMASSTKGPSQILRENGIDPSGLKFSFGPNGVIGATGTITHETDRQKIIDLLQATTGINSVTDNMSVFVEPAEPETESEIEAEPPSTDSAESSTEHTAGDQTKTYTVQSGDTLWKIASNQYGDGSKYMKIFEANTGLLTDPDRIFPGQELVIPKLD